MNIPTDTNSVASISATSENQSSASVVLVKPSENGAREMVISSLTNDRLLALGYDPKMHPVVIGEASRLLAAFILQGKKIPTKDWNANPKLCNALRVSYNETANRALIQLRDSGKHFVGVKTSKTGLVASLKFRDINDGGKRAARQRSEAQDNAELIALREAKRISDRENEILREKLANLTAPALVTA